MVSKQFEGMWRILKNFDFQINPNKDLKCILCKKILIDAKQAPCSCKFCSKCIESYLAGNNMICPGGTSECNEEYLHMDENIAKDYVANKKISKLIVKCPKDECSYRDLLINMDEHLLTCGVSTDTLSVVCPFSQMGCEEASGTKEQMGDHLQSKHYKHSNLLMDAILYLRNDIVTLTKENESLREESEKQQRCIETLKEKVDLLAVDEKDDEGYDGERDGNKGNELVKKEEITLLPNEIKFGTFIWTIENYLYMRSQYNWIDSDRCLTHTNGYTFQMRVSSYNVGHIIHCYPNCVPGKHDNGLPWPVNCEITIGIVDPISQNCLINETRIIRYVSSRKSRIRPFSLPFKPNDLLNNSLVLRWAIKVLRSD